MMVYVKPWWEIFPTTPTEVIERTIEEPAIAPAGAVVSKSILKLGAGGLLASGIGGFLLARFFGGGAAPQEQEQDIVQEPTVTPTVIPTVIPQIDHEIVPTIKPTIVPTIEPTIDVSGVTTARDIGTTTTNTITYNIQPTITRTITETITTTITPTYTLTGASQEASQQQGLDLLQIAIVGALALGGIYLFKRKA